MHLNVPKGSPGVRSKRCSWSLLKLTVIPLMFMSIAFLLQQQSLGDTISMYSVSQTMPQSSIGNEYPFVPAELVHIAETNAQRKIKERDLFMYTKSSSFEPDLFRTLDIRKSMKSTFGLLLSPYYPCFWSLEKEPSIETKWDGGKWTCGLSEMGESLSSEKKKKCIVYSFGSAGNDVFEKHINKTTKGGCEIHVFDPTSTVLAQWNYHTWWMSFVDGSRPHKGTNYPMKSLKTVMNDLNHTTVDILKFDVEGSEFDIVEHTAWNELRFGQIYFEWHGFGGNTSLVNILSLMGRMEAGGYRLFSAEPVCFSCDGQWELSWIHKDWSPVGWLN